MPTRGKMKTEMQILPNGNFEKVISPVQHDCRSPDYTWSCTESGWKLGKLLLEISDGDPHEGGYEKEIEVKFCPFCGYQPERLSGLES